jgi:hypothetical protein
MSHFFGEYGLSLAKVATLVIAVLGTAALVGLLVRHSRHRPQVEVTDLGRRYERTTSALRSQLLPAKLFKQHLKADKKRRKEQDAARIEAGPDGQRPRVFVLDFHGDIRAHGVSGLREEIAAVLSVVTERDEVLIRLENSGGLVHDHGLAASPLQRIRRRGVPDDIDHQSQVVPDHEFAPGPQSSKPASSRPRTRAFSSTPRLVPSPNPPGLRARTWTVISSSAPSTAASCPSTSRASRDRSRP